MEDATGASLLNAVQNNWFGSFLLNVVGYAIIVVPTGLLIKYLKESQEVRKGRSKTQNCIH